ncbi:MFS transporter [Aquirhabdus parva]|uniref:MFS transporter n=2 Tax=Aquirhabdus parva TaxID=2283318 RepID=A0A345PAH8_9GAMM|nr:peptide MFS transporter [Aquirhabdus parva]AXI04287.1 MFS transporter [Aquirhabdus parva]
MSTERTFFGHPRALAPLFMAELWERFSYYGIRPLLVLFLTATVMQGGYGFDRPTAAAIVGIFTGSVYLATLPGGWLADNVFGQARSMWWGSILIACGHLSIALAHLFGSTAFFVGLGLIVMGSGLFKTCASVMVGRLYEDTDQRRDAGYSIFYMGINLGSMVAPLITGLLAQEYGWSWGFGAGGLGMLISLIIYRVYAKATFDRLTNDLPPISRQKMTVIVLGLAASILAIIILIATFPPLVIASSMTYVLATIVVLYISWLFIFGGLSGNEKKRIVLCLILFVAAAVFWSANEQQPTALNLFAQDFTDRQVGGFLIPTVWFQSINPVTIVIFAPIVGLLWQRWPVHGLSSSIGKFIIGFLMCATAFGVMYLAANLVLGGQHQVSPLWLLGAYLLFSIAELFVSPVGLAAMTLIAPKHLQGQMMGLWFTAAALGNLIAGLVGGHVDPKNVAQMPDLFGHTAIALLIVAVLLAILVPLMKRWVNEKIV